MFSRERSFVQDLDGDTDGLSVHLATAEINECDRFYTYEGANIRNGWNALIQADVSEPYVNEPRLPSVDY